jgi:phage tail sheath protein FI
LSYLLYITKELLETPIMAETLISPGVLARENDLSFISPAPLVAGAAIIGPTVKGPVEIPTLVTSYSDYVNKFGTTFESGSTKQEFLTSIAVKNYFQQGGETVLVTRVVTGSFTSAESTEIAASTGSLPAPFALKTIGKGAIYNNNSGSIYNSGSTQENSDNSLVSGSADNLRWEITNVSAQKGTFTLLIRRGDDSTRNKIILETWNNLSLDPESENYIEKVIGNQVQSVNKGEDQYFIQTVGDFPNKSRYVYVSEVNLPTLNYLALDGISVNNDANGDSFSLSLPAVQSGSFYGATGNIVRTIGANNYFNNISTVTQGLTAGNYTDAINLLANQDEYLYNVISAPGLLTTLHSTPLNALISNVESRGDAIVVVDTVDYGSPIAEAVAEAGVLNTSYAATYWPWVQMRSETGKDVFVPASVVIPGVYAFTDRASAPWFAPAGLIRGGIAGVIQAERKLTKNNRDTLYDGKVNPIATFPGTGITVFGQKTLQTKASALDRVNVRRLLIELKKFFSDQARNLVFEQNTINTRSRFLSIVNPYMDSVVQRQGLFAYRVVMDETNNTNDVIDRNQLVGQVFIQPARTAEFIVLDFTIEPTGATFVA